jgi:hypothetical protein
MNRFILAFITESVSCAETDRAASAILIITISWPVDASMISFSRYTSGTLVSFGSGRRLQLRIGGISQ